MIWFIPLVLLVGAALGYGLAKRQRANKAQAALQLEVEAFAEQLEQLREQLAALQQDKADLSYQLGESEKARRYAEQRLDAAKQKLQ
jgi:uncharacterized membrane-anchored protein YhcB (DUF1043 family)